MSQKLRMIVGGNNVFRDLGFGESEAQNLMLRADLMIAIQRFIRDAGLSQTEAAKKLGVTQPRLSDLYRHRIERFSLDALVNLAARAGLAVRMTVKKAA
jgi:predicted XRE-type DNA-binding protein